MHIVGLKLFLHVKVFTYIRPIFLSHFTRRYRGEYSEFLIYYAKYELDYSVVHNHSGNQNFSAAVIHIFGLSHTP